MNYLSFLVGPHPQGSWVQALGSRSILASFAGKLWDAESVAEAAEVRNRVAQLGKAPGFRSLVDDVDDVGMGIWGEGGTFLF